MADLVCLSGTERKRAEGRVGRVGILVVESIQEAAAALTPLRERIADTVEAAGSAADAEKRIDAVIAEHQQDSDIGDAIFVPMLMADMAGQLMVKGREAKQVQLVGTAQASESFLNLPWQEAIESFKARGIVKDTEFQTLLKGTAFRSQEARKLMLEQLQKRARENLLQALEQGQTLQEFAASMRETGAELGITVENPAYLETVFRTNIQTAYGAGRFRAMEDPDVQEARPYRQYRTVGDTRVRDSHAVLNRNIYHYTDPTAKRIAPPNGYNDRCSLVSLDEEEMQAEVAAGAKLISKGAKLPKEAEPDEGFDGPPVELLEQPIE